MQNLTGVRSGIVALAALFMWPPFDATPSHSRSSLDRAPNGRDLAGLSKSAPLAQDGPFTAQAGRDQTDQVVEIRSYNLKPGTRDRFQTLFVTEALPMLDRWKVDVVGFGPSLHDSDSWYLMRAYASTEERQRSEDAFYGSDEWKKGPREAILAAIESYTTVVIRVDKVTLDSLRRTSRREPTVKEHAMQTATATDLTALIDLNQDYIQSVQTSNVKRFAEILSDDFLCSLPDGSLIDRKRFLEQTALPVTISNLEAHDVNVRLMGDFAIVHARTTYKTADGRAASGRYTDVWAKRNGTWVAVSAHVTRL
jgi:ketosteroid isomerase-like protein